MWAREMKDFEEGALICDQGPVVAFTEPFSHSKITILKGKRNFFTSNYSKNYLLFLTSPF